MPANWGAFIPALASTLQSQKFTKPGGAGLSYELSLIHISEPTRPY